MNDSEVAEILEKLHKASRDLKLALGGGFAGLLLFGSHARGEAEEDSDVDVLVVLRGLKGMKIRSRVYNMIAEHVKKTLTLVDVDLKDISKEDLAITPLLMNALYDGIIVYDEVGVLAKLKSKVMQLIKKANLVRYRTPDGKYGWKRADNKPIEAVEV